MQDEQRIIHLLLKHFNKSIGSDEELELERWLADPVNRNFIEQNLTKESILEQLQVLSRLNRKRIGKKVMTATGYESAPYRLRPLIMVLAAASLIGFLVIGAKLYYQHVSRERSATILPVIAKDILPGGNKATLVLGDGARIVLDSSVNGLVASQGNSQILKVNAGQLAYRSAGDGFSALPVTYNTLNTPRAGQFQVVLPDGTKVWLNNASVLKYPTAFTGSIRKVELSGEAYFEIARNPQKPFHVLVDQMEVTVLGTSFNVMAYSNESMVNTTLVDGSVRISRNGGYPELLQPGEQAQIDQQGALKKVKVNASSVIAWKNGFFNFNHSDFQAALRQLARWYNVDVIYKGAIPQQSFSGVIDRQLSLSQVLKIFESDEHHLTIIGNSVVVQSR